MFTRYSNFGWCGSSGWWGDNFFMLPFFHGPFGFILTLLFWGILIWLLLAIAGAIFRTLRPRKSVAIEILNNRYARGEITTEELEQMKQQI